MDKEIEIKYFMLGPTNEDDGVMFAKRLKAQPGISYVHFDGDTFILTLRYDPSMFDLDFLQDTSDFYQIRLIQDEEQIIYHAKRLWRRRMMDRLFTILFLCFSLLAVYIVIGMATESENEIWAYMGIPIILIFMGLTHRIKLRK